MQRLGSRPGALPIKQSTVVIHQASYEIARFFVRSAMTETFGRPNEAIRDVGGNATRTEAWMGRHIAR